MPKLKNPEPLEADFQISFRRTRSKKYRFIRNKSDISTIDLVTSAYDSSATFSNSENTFRLTISTQLIPKAKRKEIDPPKLWSTSRRDGVDDPLPEDDVRAIPRDLEDFKLAVSFEIDRLREKKAIFEE